MHSFPQRISPAPHLLVRLARGALSAAILLVVGAPACSSAPAQGLGGFGAPGSTQGDSDAGGGSPSAEQQEAGDAAGSDAAGPGQPGAGAMDAGTPGSVADAGGAAADAGADASGHPAPPPDPQCLDDMKDGNETGVDCGGSCAACPNVSINPPNANNGDQSACSGGNGYMCPRSMLFSPEMKQAAMTDWSSGDAPFVYGTVGHDPDTGGIDATSNTCCQCYQLVFDTPMGASGLPIPKPMIVQAFDTQAGGGKNFDVYMGDGGYGANNACAGVSDAMYTSFPDQGGNYAGGVKAARYAQCASGGQYSAVSIETSTCQNYVASQCDMIDSASSTTQSTTQGSCIESNFVDSQYHLNWNVFAKRVECPDTLTRVTGCKLNDQSLPAANPAAKDSTTVDSSFRSGYTTTTMQDCCKPTCAWPANVSNTDSTWSTFYTCNQSGDPLTQ